MNDSDSTPVRLALLPVEPFRAFFPLAVLSGIAGVALWPLFYGGHLPYYPGLAHARIMVEGFMGGFLIGFLGTALPRMLSAIPLTGREFLCLIALYVGATTSHLGNRTVLGDGLFATFLLVFAISMTVRYWKRRDILPPGLLLAVIGIFCGIAGSCLWLLPASAHLPGFVARLAGPLLYHGFLLLPVLGVGAFLFPRFFNLPSLHNFPGSRNPPPGWAPRARRAALAGTAIAATIGMEAAGWVGAAYLIRALVTLVYFLGEVSLAKLRGFKGSLALCLLSGLTMLIVGQILLGLFPDYTKAFEHTIFVTGYGLIALSVASRVVLGHSGRTELLQSRSFALLFILFCLFTAMVLRVSGDLLLRIQVSHYLYGAEFWIAGVFVWGLIILPKVFVVEPDN